jgi:hypothetical protein
MTVAERSCNSNSAADCLERNLEDSGFGLFKGDIRATYSGEDSHSNARDSLIVEILEEDANGSDPMIIEQEVTPDDEYEYEEIEIIDDDDDDDDDCRSNIAADCTEYSFQTLQYLSTIEEETESQCREEEPESHSGVEVIQSQCREEEDEGRREFECGDIPASIYIPSPTTLERPKKFIRRYHETAPRKRRDGSTFIPSDIAKKVDRKRLQNRDLVLHSLSVFCVLHSLSILRGKWDTMELKEPHQTPAGRSVLVEKDVSTKKKTTAKKTKVKSNIRQNHETVYTEAPRKRRDGSTFIPCDITKKLEFHERLRNRDLVLHSLFILCGKWDTIELVESHQTAAAAGRSVSKAKKKKSKDVSKLELPLTEISRQAEKKKKTSGKSKKSKELTSAVKKKKSNSKEGSTEKKKLKESKMHRKAPVSKTLQVKRVAAHTA